MLAKIAKADWFNSFEGKAIVDRKGVFVTCNDQFYTILGVTPAEIIGKKFQDITPIGEIRDRDIENAELVADGSIDSYVLPKTYVLARNRTVDVVLSVTRIPLELTEDFEFYLSKIVPAEESLKTTCQKDGSTKLDSDWFSELLRFVKGYAKIALLIGLTLGAAIAGFIYGVPK
jgi:PAS domain S-box-containing protein